MPATSPARMSVARALRGACGVLAAVAAAVCGPRLAHAQYDFESEPINYATAPVDEPVSRLIERLERGEETLSRDERHGYLPALLKVFGAPASSQVLVFTKTSFQRERIAPRTPRAIYFSDDVYIGSVQDSPLLELSAVDPTVGPVFYTVDQAGSGPPRFVRQNHECTQCHASSLTRGLPGHIVRSVYPDRTGMPILSSGSFLTDHRSPLKERWGGWYVTGTHGRQRHMGNLMLSADHDPDRLDRESGANMTSLDTLLDPSSCLTAHSDIVALMVLEHQAAVHNQITQAMYQTRFALRDGETMNQALNRPAGTISESTDRRIHNAGDAVVEWLLMCKEAPLTDAIQGTSGFAEEFAAQGPRDRQGRSLRDFDLRRRMFKYPCSYLVYSRAFTSLPAPLKEYVYSRLHAILTAPTTQDDFAHLTKADRRAILEILVDTAPDVPESWHR